jgi:N-dimethylarginine dimethylaminohydrolase
MNLVTEVATVNGPEGARAATLGGKGWLERIESHSEELTHGRYWARCGANSEATPLLAVALAAPPESLSRMRDPNADLAIRKPETEKLQRQFEDLQAFFEANGVRTHVLRDRDAPPNIIFMRDLFVMTPAGAILARPAAHQRADEARIALKFLADHGIPVVGTVIGHGTFEGADCLWIGPHTVLIGVGNRTNLVGAKQVGHLLETLGVEAIQVEIPNRTQHLLGIVNLLDRNMAAVDVGLITSRIADVLRDAGIAMIGIDDEKELREGRSLNFLALGDRRILAPAGPTETYRRYSEEGFEVHTLDISEYIACAGGIGCAVGIIERQ